MGVGLGEGTGKQTQGPSGLEQGEVQDKGPPAVDELRFQTSVFFSSARVSGCVKMRKGYMVSRKLKSWFDCMKTLIIVIYLNIIGTICP